MFSITSKNLGVVSAVRVKLCLPQVSDPALEAPSGRSNQLYAQVLPSSHLAVLAVLPDLRCLHLTLCQRVQTPLAAEASARLHTLACLLARTRLIVCKYCQVCRAQMMVKDARK